MNRLFSRQEAGAELPPFCRRLDGGPVACRQVSAGGYWRDFCGRYELAVHGGRLQSEFLW